MSCRKNLLQVQITVPSYFVCPISLELMLDPVTLSSGQTFDRHSIEQWLDDGRRTCPVSRLPIDPNQEEPIPNHTLRRMIQAWCLQNAGYGVDRILTPRQSPSLRDIPSLVDRLSQPSSSSSPHSLLDALQLLSRLALDRPLSRRSILLAGALPSLIKLLSRSISGFGLSLAALPSSTSDEALKLLDLLIHPDHESLLENRQLCSEDLVISLANLISRASKPDSRLRAASILIRLQPSVALKRRMGEIQGFMSSLVELISDGDQASKAALGLLVDVCSSSNLNRIAATEAGVVSALSELLELSNDQGPNCDRAKTEATLKALEVMCQCAEGRAAVVREDCVLVAVVKQMRAVSETAAQHAVNILLLVTKWAPEASKVKSLVVKQGALLMAVAVAQSDATSDTKLAARKLAASLREAIPPSQLARTMRLE